MVRDEGLKGSGEGEGKGDGKGEKRGERERELRAVFVLGTIVAGSEAGFALPAVSGFFVLSRAFFCCFEYLRYGGFFCLVGKKGGEGGGYMGGW